MTDADRQHSHQAGGHHEHPPAAPGPAMPPAAPGPAMAQPVDRVAEQKERNLRFAPVLPQRVSWARVAAFVVLALGLAWAVCAPMWASGQGLNHPLAQVLMVAMMYTPTVAALLVTFVGGRPPSIPRRLGLGPLRPVGRVVGVTAISLAVFCLLPFLAVLLGGALGLVQLDLTSFSAAQAQLDQVAQLTGSSDGMTPQQLVLVTVLVVPLNALVSSLAAFGEELGWRGWLVPNLLPLGRWPALLLSGLVWSVWHAPIILLGYNFGYTDIRGLALMTCFCLPLGVLLGWLRLRTASLWPAVVAHGAVNAATSATLILLAADQLQDVRQLGLGTFVGIPGWVLTVALIVLLVLTGQLRKQAEPGVPSSV